MIFDTFDFISSFYTIGIWDVISGFFDIIGKKMGAGFMNIYKYITSSDKRKYGCLGVILFVMLAIIIVCSVLLWPVSDNTGMYYENKRAAIFTIFILLMTQV